MVRHPHGVTVGVLPNVPGAVVDGYQEADSWGPQVDYAGCAVAPGAVAEVFEPNRDGAGVEFTVYFPPDAVVGPRDRVILPNHADPFDVDGVAQAWGRNPFTGRQSGIVVQLGRYDG